MGSQLSTLSSQLRARRGGPVRLGSQSEGGFALLLTLTLLSFLVVLLVGLAIYSRVETAIAGNMQRQTQARENALLALNVALGQLQKNAGPDTRVTATAEAIAGVNSQKKHYTGVWSSTDATVEPVWLVSGVETGTATDITAAIPVANQIALVGVNTDGSAAGGAGNPGANNVVAPLQIITAPGVPGQTGSVAVGKYAWWIGDQGVKAPVAIADASDTVDYAPFSSAELRSRIRQQIALGAGAADSGGNPVFEPRDANNSALVAGQKIATPNQLPFLRNASNGTLGLSLLRQNFHTWSPNNYAVLANTKSGGLRQDLSLQPTLLGNAFAAWANYPAYMEKLVADPPVSDGEGNSTPTTTSSAPVISPPYGDDPLRRRYVMQPHVLNGEGSHQVGPVLTYFLISFNVRTVNKSTAANAPLEVRARWMVSLWNPYTSSLVPEDLQIEVSGLPSSIRIVNDNPLRAGDIVGTFSLASDATFGSPLTAALPWASAAIPTGVSGEDRKSWFPGRVYTWRSAENNTGAAPPDEGYASDFYSRTLDDGGQGVTRPLSGTTIADGGDDCHLEVSGSANLRITIYAVRPSGRVRLSGCVSPDFVTSFPTAIQGANLSGYQFSYVFRLAESLDTLTAPGTWLTTDGRDLRRRTLPSECYVAAENGNDPSQYGSSYKKISSPDRLLDRATDSLSYNEDVTIFELPRAPLLSLGALQHFRLVGQRPFMIGNPWGTAFELNSIRLGELFDRFYFSGLVDGVAPSSTTTGDLILPNPLLKPLRKPDATKVTIDDVRALMNPPTTTDADGNVVPSAPASSYSSKFFLQGGAFNLNSVNANAWAAVLRSVRFPAPQAFSYLNASESTGTAADTNQATVQSTDAQFFRFSQSAQETYKAEPGMADNDSSATSPANTHLFRRGMRTLAAADVAALAAKIVELNSVKQATGPFRSLEEFLSPSALFAGVDADGNALAPRSLLEAAIADAGINSSIAEFSSQWLTQADVMTALAPVLFPRSDTFVIRTYGEAVNPATNATEGRAWCEAIVQRLPEYFADPANNPPEKPPGGFDVPVDPDNPGSGPTVTDRLNQTYGRRFKVVSFRWLTRSDI